jgi:SAM-dependent methyltransferase
VAGGKNDYTIKWWDHRRYQEVIDHFNGKIQFVQVGENAHYHPPLRGVIDLRGKTDLRQLVRLVYHSQGVLAPVSLLMHLAAAVEMRPDYDLLNRPCVVVAGGREPPHWEAYPHHQFIHTIGALRCCDFGGCWKSRTVPLGDGDDKDSDLCVDVVGSLPRCMDMITAAEVINRIQLYVDGGAIRYLSTREAAAAERADSRNGHPLSHQLFKPRSFEEAVDSVVGECNDLTKEQRWEGETPAFAREILRLLPAGGDTILDYGCGLGRIAKEILKNDCAVKVIGVDDSDEEIALARQFVNSERFFPQRPLDLNAPVDLVYCVYVLQHVPAIEIREILQRIHHWLKDDGRFVYCSSDYRMAIRFDQPGFEDDRRLGVDIRHEISRYFIQCGELFSQQILENNQVLRKMITGCGGGLAHPALVFRKRLQNAPLFNYRPAKAHSTTA